MSMKVSKVSTEKHEGDIMSVAFNNGYVFTGGADGLVKVNCFLKFIDKLS